MAIINYTPDPYINAALKAAGFGVIERGFSDGSSEFTTFDPANEPAAQAFIDGYDPLPDAKLVKIDELKAEGLVRANAVYGETVFENVASIQILIDQNATYEQQPSGLAPRLQALADINTAIQDSRAVINAFTTVAEVESYDVVVDPVWPA